MGKGIAITTILLLLVGSLVAGVTVYYTYRSVTGSPLSEHECRGMMISWCIGCSNLGYTGGSGMDSQLSDCANRYWDAGDHNNCDAEDDCSAFLPRGGGGTTTCNCADYSGDNDGDGNIDIMDIAMCNTACDSGCISDGIMGSNVCSPRGNGIDPTCTNNPGNIGCYRETACPEPDSETEGCTCYDGTDCDSLDNGGNACCCIC